MEQENNKNKVNYMLPASILIAGVLIAGSVIYSTGLKNKEISGVQANIEEAASEDLLKLSEKDVVMGEKNAPVEVIIYSDPSCPFCAAAAGFNQQVLDYLKKNNPSWQAPIPGIIDNYVKTGKVKLAFRYFPGHGTGENAMKLLFCANEQGKFWELHDKVLANQDAIEDLDKIKGFAADVGIDVSKLNSCFMAGKYDSKIAEDMESGKSLGIEGTPAFFVNGKLYTGAQPFSQFKLIIDKELE